MMLDEFGQKKQEEMRAFDADLFRKIVLGVEAGDDVSPLLVRAQERGLHSRNISFSPRFGVTYDSTGFLPSLAPVIDTMD